MFSAASFSQASFTPDAWLFDVAMPPIGGIRRVMLPRSAVDAQRFRMIEEDDVLLALCGAVCAAYGVLR